MATYDWGPSSNYRTGGRYTPRDTAGGSFWKDVTNWGRNVYDSAENWWDSSFGDIDIPDIEKTYTGIGRREISIPDQNLNLTARGDGNGFQWWDTVKKYAGYAEDYVISPVKDVLDWTKDLYNIAPQWVKDLVKGDPDKTREEDRRRLQEWVNAQRKKRSQQGIPAGAATRNIGLGRRQTKAFRPPQPMGKGGYGDSPLARAIMEQASQNDAIRTTLAGNVSPGSRTIHLPRKEISPQAYRRVTS